jgi:hypothetical protein
MALSASQTEASGRAERQKPDHTAVIDNLPKLFRRLPASR